MVSAADRDLDTDTSSGSLFLQASSAGPITTNIRQDCRSRLYAALCCAVLSSPGKLWIDEMCERAAPQVLYPLEYWGTVVVAVVFPR